MKIVGWVVTAWVFCGLTGCSGSRNKGAWEQYERQLKPEIGKASVETYVKRWGTPTQKIPVQDGTIYCWRISHGSRSGGVGYILSVGSSYEAYDDLRLKFDGKQVMQEWTADCVR